MKAYLQEAFAKDNREQYLRNKATINAKNNRYYARNRERILAKRKELNLLKLQNHVGHIHKPDDHKTREDTETAAEGSRKYQGEGT